MGCPRMTSPVSSEFWEVWKQGQTSTICHTKYPLTCKRGVLTPTSYSAQLPSGPCKPKLSDNMSPVFSGFWVTASNMTDACWGLHLLVEGEPAQDTEHVQSALSFHRGAISLMSLSWKEQVQSEPALRCGRLTLCSLRRRKYYLQVVRGLCKREKKTKQDYSCQCSHFCCVKGLCLPAFSQILNLF